MKIYKIRESFYPDTHLQEEKETQKLACLPVDISALKLSTIREGQEQSCFSLRIDTSDKGERSYRVRTGYYVGVHWLVQDQLAVYVHPKFGEDNQELNYLKMLSEALASPESIEHLEDLVQIDFDQPPISIEQQDDLLTPLLVMQYLQLLRRIVRKGLKKSYYRVERTLHARIKGKVMVPATIKRHHARQRMLHTDCRYDEFGVDYLENRLLKKAFQFGLNALASLRAMSDSLEEMIRYIRPAFAGVSEEVDIREIKAFQPNPLFPESSQALTLAKLILRRYAYNLTQTQAKQVPTPPFWIDMSKLFELYVLGKLRAAFPGREEVMYQPTIGGRRPDYLLRSQDEAHKWVVDAKYKNYGANALNIEDIRQVSAYARMEGVYTKLGQDTGKVIDVLVIYPDLAGGVNQILPTQLKEEGNEIRDYVSFFKLGVKLPMQGSS